MLRGLKASARVRLVPGLVLSANVSWAWGEGPTSAILLRIPPSPSSAACRCLASPRGLDSRVQRREDVHYPAPSSGAKCSDAGIPEQYPDRCVGPAKLLPILNEAFQKGTRGESPRVQATRIEAALLWFLYVSTPSEVTSCASKPQDCDSVWAYYTGGHRARSATGTGSVHAGAGAGDTRARLRRDAGGALLAQPGQRGGRPAWPS
ncbi:hypothetical protein [Archangium sp.]|uniref:hypothetical protein n=1 Tax=Archangium sp. TaxID=1872627 RepID=UPI002D5352E7|nr:hypothetical protein [Archangium sp.]HYO52557.1 hypothetical protein [Archangium sp.]